MTPRFHKPAKEMSDGEKPEELYSVSILGQELNEGIPLTPNFISVVLIQDLVLGVGEMVPWYPSCGRSEFSSQHSLEWLTMLVTQAPANTMPSSGLHRYLYHMHIFTQRYTHKCAYTQMNITPALREGDLGLNKYIHIIMSS